MPCITRQRVGKYTYLYESTSFRNAEGKPRNKKIRIGKIDPVTGEAVYLEEYLERLATSGCGIPQVKTEDNGLPTAAEIHQAKQILDARKSYGTFHLFRELAKDINLLPLLQEACPKLYKEIFTLACFLVETQEPLLYCSEWLMQTESLPVSNMSSQRVSEIFSKISMDERDTFFASWIRSIKESRYVALDITSISSYSQLMQSCEWGYNRDHDDLPQINLCMLFGEGSGFPVYQTTYHGSIRDVSTLRSTLSEVAALVPQSCQMRVVMDKGFFSAGNVDAMLDKEHPVHFLLSVPFTSGFAKRLVDSERKDIDQIENTILTSDGAIRGVHKVRTWKTARIHTEIHAHIYFNPVKEAKERNELYAYVTELKQEAMRDPLQKHLQAEFGKYLIIRKSSTSPTGYTVNVRKEVIADRMRTCGWMVLISDTETNPQEALDIYRTKDVVEKSFERLKCALDLKRLRVHKDERMENKLFVSFVALLLIGALHQRMKDAKLYKHFTMHELLLKVRKLSSSYVRGTRILQPVSKEQRNIFEKLGLNIPVG